MRTVMLAMGAVFGCGVLFLMAEDSSPEVFTASQAVAGRTAYESTCGKCHTPTLLGRKGEAGEQPPLGSLPEDMQKTVRNAGGIVPPLAGPEFMTRWAERTTKDLSARIKTAVGGFPPEGTDETTYLDLTAYVLQVNGATAGANELTGDTAVGIGTATRPRATAAH